MGGCPDPRGPTRGMGFERRRVAVKKADGVESRSRENVCARVCVRASGAPVESKWP